MVAMAMMSSKDKNGADILFGDAGNDFISGGVGQDQLSGGLGNDTLSGDQGSDHFFVMESGGNDVVSGGSGWTDVIEVTNLAGDSAPDEAWTVSIDGGDSFDITSETGFLDLGSDRSGSIVFSDGTEVAFDGIEKIEW